MKRQHTMDCPYPEGCSCGASEWNARERELQRLRSSASSASGIERMICKDIETRQEMGISKYGTTVADNDLELVEWLQHAYEECLDQAVYLKRAIFEIRSKQNAKDSPPNEQ